MKSQEEEGMKDGNNTERRIEGGGGGGIRGPSVVVPFLYLYNP